MSNSKNGKMPASEKITYGFGNLAANLMFTTAGSFITFYYTDVVGLSVVVASNILLWARVFDGASDLVMGTIVDRSVSSKGKARPWIMRMAVPYALALILLFSSPDFLGETGKAVYAFVTYVLAMAGIYTATMVPYNSMMSTSTSDPVERGVMSTMRTLFGYGGATLVNAIVWPLITILGGDKKAWTIMAALFGFAATVLLIALYKNSQERVIEAAGSDKKSGGKKEDFVEEKLPLSRQVSNLVKNKYWLILIGYLFATFIDSGLGGINIYYATWILGDGNKMGVIGTALTIPIMIGALAVPVLMKKTSKRNLCIAGSVIYIAGTIIIALAPENFYIVVLGVVIKGFGKAPGAVAGYAMLGDVVDYGEWKTKVRNEGLVFSAATFGEKVGSGIGGLIMGVILSIGGYVSSAAAQSAGALTAIKVVFIYAPIVFAVLSLLLMLIYDLDKKLPQIRREMDR